MKKPSLKKITYGYLELFRYATWVEISATLLGVSMGILTACGLPIIIILYGEITKLLIDRSIPGSASTATVILNIFGGGKIIINGTIEMNRVALRDDTLAYLYSNIVFCVVQFVVATLCVQSLNWSAHRQICRIRQLFLESVIHQDMSWFDTQTNLNFASRITEDLEKLKEGIGEKIGQFTYLASSFIICFVIALLYGWELTLVVSVAVPIMIIASSLVSRYQTTMTEKELQMYSLAGGVAEEVLSGIRTVVAFGGEEKEVERYSKRLQPAETYGKKRGLLTGFGGGFTWLMMYWLYAIAFWYGVRLILRDFDLPPETKTYDPGVLMIIMFNIIAGAQNFTMASPHLEAFAVARGSGRSIFSLMDRVPLIDSLSGAGRSLRSTRGEIELNDIWFNYPSRPDVKILRGLNLKIGAGETLALVGPSGCGKSTILQLVQRLYDPESGTIAVDGEPVTSLNPGSLRSHIGVVGQEPVLFSGTIKENIALGKRGNATDKEIEAAAKSANCHDFITHLPHGYDTLIGERGAQLSGGQKQRIAIARAIIRDPKIMLLDEATSALDLRSERRVQAALDQASKGRTTLVVTHRLSTIRNAARIIYIDQGRVAEDGTHEQLMNLQGFYYKLVQTDLENRKSEATILDKEEHEQTDEVPEPGEDEAVDTVVDFNRRQSVLARKVSQRDSISPENRRQSISSLRRLQSRHSMTSLRSFNRPQAIIPIDSNDLNIEEDEEEQPEPVANFALLKLNAKEWPLLLSGTIASAIVGSVLPIYSVLFSEVFGEFANQDVEDMMVKINFYAIFFICFGILCGVGTFAQTFLFTVSGIKLTTRLRVLTFSSYLKQEIGWFDDNKNSVGALCSRLSSDAAAVQGATGMRIGTVLQGIATLLIGIIISFCFSWKMTLVSMISIPVVIGGIFLEGYMNEKFQVEERKAMEGATNVATEAIMNIRTVQSLGVERNFLSKYGVSLAVASDAGRGKIRLRGMIYALGVTTPTLCYVISLCFGAYLVSEEGLHYKVVILVCEALIFGAWMMGQVLAFAPNFNSARISGARVMALMQRKPKIVSAPGLDDHDSWFANGNISWKDVHFSYPTRSDVAVMRGLDLDIQAGQSVALVGHSGCGKSTCLQLLQRLYDPNRGNVSIDSRNIATELSLPKLRSQLGIVSQEPILFDRTVAENIAYGDNSRSVPLEEVIEAAKKANIHQFIASLPLGYDTSLGANGAQLSGGQKQRIAIARALVRNPRVLLLDEATSALDTQSEKQVQQALDVAKEGRTSITIAHRLATIQNSDVICVIDKGKIVENGKHSELMDLQGIYYELHCLQAAGLAAMSDA